MDQNKVEKTMTNVKRSTLIIPNDASVRVGRQTGKSGLLAVADGNMREDVDLSIFILILLGPIAQTQAVARVPAQAVNTS